MKTKICTKCRIEYPVTLQYFHIRKRNKSGLGSWCQKCYRRYHKKYREQHFKQIKGYREKHRGEYGDTIKGYLRRLFHNIKKRCINPKDKSYNRYGGRGIKCLFTSNEFVDYVINDMQVDPRGLEIDRINNNGHYEPENIRFVTHKKNCNNKRVKLELK